MPPRTTPRLLIRGVSGIWSALSAGARAASARGWLASTRLPVRVVSVGNLQAGGAGKTPLVAQIAREAAERGITACVLSRGYGGEWERGSGGVILPGDAEPDARLCGDEAALLHDLAPQAVIGVGADRARQWERARSVVKERGLEIGLVILDDGFQHWKIRKDADIVALTSRGPDEVPHRDALQALRHASLVVWTKGEKRPWVPESTPFAQVEYRLSAPSAIEARRALWLVTGVADGSDVVRLARASGYRIERHVSFPDHARYAEPRVRELIEGARQAGAGVALTGKDWVKWREMPGVRRGNGPGMVLVLEPDLEWREGREAWNRVLWGS
jgi:tetraacyldisaccharide 4'-kinase